MNFNDTFTSYDSLFKPKKESNKEEEYRERNTVIERNNANRITGISPTKNNSENILALRVYYVDIPQFLPFGHQMVLFNDINQQNKVIMDAISRDNSNFELWATFLTAVYAKCRLNTSVKSDVFYRMYNIIYDKERERKQISSGDDDNTTYLSSVDSFQVLNVKGFNTDQKKIYQLFSYSTIDNNNKVYLRVIVPDEKILLAMNTSIDLIMKNKGTLVTSSRITDINLFRYLLMNDTCLSSLFVKLIAYELAKDTTLRMYVYHDHKKNAQEEINTILQDFNMFYFNGVSCVNYENIRNGNISRNNNRSCAEKLKNYEKYLKEVLK